VSNIAEWTPARAKVSQDHESRGTFAEALSYIGAGGFFAHRVQLLFPQDALDLVEFLAVGRAHPDPGRLPQQLVRGLGQDFDWVAGRFGCAFLADFCCHGRNTFLFL
jgi:hypothetical protein